MSVLAEQSPRGEAPSDFVQKSTARGKWVRRRKAISKARALTVSHISPSNILPREVAGPSSPFRGLKRGRQVVRTHPRRTGVILGGSLAKFSVTITHLKFPLSCSPFLSGICKLGRKRKAPRKIAYTHSWLLGPLIHFAGFTECPAQQYLPHPKIFSNLLWPGCNFESYDFKKKCPLF